jgi:hypothetical protein
MQRTVEARLIQLPGFGREFRARGRRAQRQRAPIRLALDFCIWRRHDREELDDGFAVDRMTAIADVATAKPADSRQM